ncbi:MAG: hypothetical protein EBT33_22275, partial [Betaproteobacteria bacterium]|nr:hypothetical protein [Betaproteobacteria bacterium]
GAERAERRPDAGEARQMRFLLARGFSAEVVRKVIAQAD